MLAAIGFITVSVLLAAFAYTFDNLVKKRLSRLRPFGAAYGLIALAFLMWGILSLLNAYDLLPASVVVGDGLLFVASVCAALSLVPKRFRKVIGITAAVLLTVIVYVRARLYFPTPILQDGLIYFGTPNLVAIILSLTVILVWLPASMKVAAIITTSRGLKRYYPMFISAYALAIISASIFIQAHRPVIVISSFVLFGVSVLLLLISNAFAATTKIKVDKARSKHATK